AAWARWTDDADADQRCDFYGLESLVARAVIESGECFVQMLVTPDGLRLRLLDSEMVPLSETRVLDEGRRVIQGVELHAAGTRLAYPVYKRRPAVPRFSTDLIRVPAEQMLHVGQVLVPGQIRGVSWLTPVLLRLRDIHACDDAQLQRQAIAALFAGFIRRPEGATPPGMLGESAANPEPTLEPGTISYLAEGEDITFPSTPPVSDVVAFLQLQLRAVAAGLGVPAHLVEGDMSQTNYSSIRGALVEYRARIEALQHQLLVFQLCRPVWKAWILTEV